MSNAKPILPQSPETEQTNKPYHFTRPAPAELSEASLLELAQQAAFCEQLAQNAGPFWRSIWLARAAGYRLAMAMDIAKEGSKRGEQD